jgi:phosphoesterase, MJ0936 family
MKIGLLSDTHSSLPDAIFHHFAQVDEIWHAGDIGNMEVVHTLQTFKPLRAVYGNIDGHEIRQLFPEDLFFSIEQVKIYMTHIGGYPPNYNARTKAILLQNRPHLFICGHSHILKVIPDNTLQLLHINPGACGLQGWHKVKTLIRFEIAVDRIANLEVIELGRK